MNHNLLNYDFPRDLKNMNSEQLKLLTYSIREFLIDRVSKTGGHLASNLGVVELTVALHKAFNCPEDKLIWDVGHQAYVHKILTNRGGEFLKLRQFNGLSGFPKASESPYDCYDTGHSSTSISAAAGMAAARDIKNENHEVIAVIGDGSLTGGMAFEALNNVGETRSKVIVILNDNEMSISPNVGGISKHLGNLRTSKGYLSAKNFVKNKIRAIPNIGEGIAKGLAGIKNDIKYFILAKGGIIFEELGFTYFGPIDGHDIDAMLEVFDKAKKLNEPVFIHVLTKKGKGYKNAENEPAKFHGIAPFNPETGQVLEKSEKATYSGILGKYLCRKAEDDQRLVAITAAMCEATGLWEFSQAFPNRFFDVGIAEEHAVSFACGLAKEGMKPLVAIYSTFLQRSYDQLIIDACMQNLPIVFALDRAGVVGADGETHNGIFDLSYLSQMPNMTVLTPKDGNQFEEMLDYAFSLGTPCAIRYPRGTCDYDNYIMSTSLFDGKNLRIKEGKDLDIWACGKMLATGEKVVGLLAERGIEAGLVDVATVKPMDFSQVNPETKYFVTLEDNIIQGGFGHSFKAGLLNGNAKVVNIGWPDAFIPQGTFDELADCYGLSAEKIAERICEDFEGKA